MIYCFIIISYFWRKWFWHLCSTANNGIIRHWYIIFVIQIKIAHQLVPVLASYFKIIFEALNIYFYAIGCIIQFKIFHPLTAYDIHFKLAVLIVLDQDNPTWWNTLRITKKVITLFNYSFCKFVCPSSLAILEYNAYCLCISVLFVCKAYQKYIKCFQ